MTRVTIDQLDKKVHERFAQDQYYLDPIYINESSPHAEITATSSIYHSQWEALFEIQVKNIHWALFPPPPDLYAPQKRFFTHKVLPRLSKKKFQKEKDTLTALFECLDSLDDLMEQIHTRKLQYQKG